MSTLHLTTRTLNMSTLSAGQLVMQLRKNLRTQVLCLLPVPGANWTNQLEGRGTGKTWQLGNIGLQPLAAATAAANGGGGEGGSCNGRCSPKSDPNSSHSFFPGLDSFIWTLGKNYAKCWGWTWAAATGAARGAIPAFRIFFLNVSCRAY